MILFLYLISIEFSFNTGSFISKNRLPELRIFYEIPRNELTYTKFEGVFLSEFLISCSLIKNSKEIGDTWIIKDSLPTYEATTIKTLIKRELKIEAPPGTYKLKIEIKDLNSQRVGKKVKEVILNDLTSYHLQAISSLIFTGSKGFNPKVYQKGDKGELFFEVYNFSGAPFELVYCIGKFEKCIKFDNLDFVNLVKINIPSEVELPDSLEFGLQKVLVSVGEIEVQDSLYIEEPFWVKDYEKKVKELIYIGEQWEIDALLAAPLALREEYWKKFWEKRDPSPGTELNELEDEYFKRIDYTNEHFSCVQEGWKTDRGKVYIKLGPPDEVNSHPFEIDRRPYEVWYYYSRKMEFIFVDEYGFGDYILVSPKYWKDD